MTANSTRGRMHFIVFTESFDAKGTCRFLARIAGLLGPNSPQEPAGSYAADNTSPHHPPCSGGPDVRCASPRLNEL
ncbi:hypothetical protein ACFVU3_27225 [Streptomyces sp. NPDC058052]|uniref:hypothetical protein n=1 Tax=Streptomyces sp. NPDC058052 TaxID=3346316 RepID=UPI0036DFBF17